MEMISAHPIAFAIGFLVTLIFGGVELGRVLRHRRQESPRVTDLDPLKQRYHSGGVIPADTPAPRLDHEGECRISPEDVVEMRKRFRAVMTDMPPSQPLPGVEPIELWDATNLIKPVPNEVRIAMRNRFLPDDEVARRVEPTRPHAGPLVHEVVGGSPRIPMRNRYMKTDETPFRSNLMADQILRDQAIAHEEPGKLVHAPDPDDTTFYSLRETINRFTFIIGKEGFMAISEATPDGAETPVYEVPNEWAEPMIAAVFEVARLRRGWQNPDKP